MKVIAFMVKTEAASSEDKSKSEQYTKHEHYTRPEHYTPTQTTITTTDKLTNVLNSRTLCDITYKLDSYKNIPTHSSLTTLTHILECYDHTYKILQSLGIDPQRITQSSRPIQTTLESVNIVFKASNHI